MEKLYHKSLYRHENKFYMVYSCNHENIVFLLTENGPKKLEKLPKNSRQNNRTVIPPDLYKIFLDFNLKEFLIKDILTNLGD